MTYMFDMRCRENGIEHRLTKIKHPYPILYPAIICMICLGVYSLQYSVFDVGLLLGFGLLGHALRIFNFEAAPLLMSFVLGPLLEENFRRALLIQRGNVLALFGGPVNIVMLSLAGLVFAWAIVSRIRVRRRAALDLTN